ncbi:MAG: hypothetical protein IJ240_00570 [Clostridia bacterium]|nr:hypothetical protein [Clostridia bacterium]
MLPTQIAYYILLFFTGSVLGWCMEVICKLIQFHRFINRGFLIGPYCPIYGFGTVLLTALLSRFTEDPFAVFGLAILLCGILEYLTSWLMEKLFHARWWDYSDKRFNLNGRVCANTLIPFGLLGLLMVYFVKPTLFSLYARIPERALNILCYALLALLTVDTVFSAITLLRIRRGAADASGDSTEALTAAVRSALARESAAVRRVLRAFPDARLYNRQLLERLRAERERVRQSVREGRERARAELAAREKQLNEELKKLKDRR